jgi:phenol hydroxylase P1 protein
MAAESAANRTLLQGWVAQWRSAWIAALAPLATAVLGEPAGAAALAEADAALSARLGRLGLNATTNGAAA